MIYIIDANNLAGKLKLLGRSDFDRRLSGLFLSFNQDKNKEIKLVFDGRETMGDKVALSDKITVYRSPRDAYYRSADDKIVEMVERYLHRGQRPVTVVTEDIELSRRVEAVAQRLGRKIILEKASRWADKLVSDAGWDVPDDGYRDLAAAEQAAINSEFLKRWRLF